MPNPLITIFDENDTGSSTPPVTEILEDGFYDGYIPPATDFNYIFKQNQNAARKSRNDGVWDWEDPTVNTDITYSISSMVRHNGIIYLSDIDTNEDEPGVANWTLASAAAASQNILVNGDMRISQRGDYTSPIAIGTNEYSLDRCKSAVSAVNATVQQLSTAQPAGTNAKSIKFTATSSGTGSMGCFQPTEEFALFSGKTVTLSAWVKSDNVNARVGILDGSGGYLAMSDPHTGGGDWEKLTATGDVDSAPIKLDCYVRIMSAVGGGVSINSTDFIETTQMKLEESSIATDFEPIADNDKILSSCLRFGEVFDDVIANASIGGGSAYSTTQARIEIPMHTKRDVSSLSLEVVNPTNFVLYDGVASTAATTITLSSDSTEKLAILIVTVAAGLTQYRPYTLRGDGTPNNSSIFIDAEI